MSATHGALVAVAKVRPHPNADRLKLAQVGGFQVVVGEDTNDGDIVLFFSSDLQLSEEYATANDLVGYTDSVTGERKGQYFPKNRKVRSQKFRGEISEGYIAPLNSLSFIYNSDHTPAYMPMLEVGMIIDEYGGVPICNKFVSKATRQFQGTPKSRKEWPQFPKHFDTEQLGYHYTDIPVGALVTITEKLHGTSGRTGYVQTDVEQPRTLWDKIRRRTSVSRDWITISGTRNVVLDGAASATGYYSDESFRQRAASQFDSLHKGEIAYYEIVGWVGPDSPIMSPWDLTGSKDYKKVGTGHFTYGALPGTCEVFVYRITQTVEDAFGNLIHRDLPWHQVQRRCPGTRCQDRPHAGSVRVY